MTPKQEVLIAMYVAWERKVNWALEYGHLSYYRSSTAPYHSTSTLEQASKVRDLFWELYAAGRH